MTVVAIDGPAGSGKSTIAAGLATRLGVRHVDTGAYYRAATLAVLRAGVDAAGDPDAAAAAVRAASIRRVDGRTLLDGADVEAEIRGAAVTAAVSSVSRIGEVRALLVALQRAELDGGGGVVEGRDAGTVVVPAADLKVWLTAGVEARAQRRAAQLGVDRSALDDLAADLRRRDAQDAAQMDRATEAVEVDTTGLTVAETVELLAGMATGVAKEPS